MQLDHHVGNWIQLPAALRKRLDKFADDVKPPMVDDEFNLQIKRATENYGNEICRITREHLDRKRKVTEVEASRLNPADLDKAKPIAEKYLQSRLGSRLGPDQRKTLLERAMDKIGSAVPAFTATNPAQPQAQQLNGNLNQQPVSRSSSNTLKRKALASSPSPLPIHCRNKFDVLRRDDDGPHADEATPIHENPAETPIKKAQQATANRSMSILDDSQELLVERVVVHDGQKEDWEVEVGPQSRVLVIGDSNLRNADPRSIPSDWEVHASPGAKYRHVTNILQRWGESLSRADPEDMLDHLIIQVGINHREESIDVIREEVIKMERTARGLARTVSIMGISTAQILDEAIRRNVEKINQLLARGSLEYIPPLPIADVHIRPGDSYKIHFDPGTIDRVLKSAVSNVRGLPLN